MYLYCWHDTSGQSNAHIIKEYGTIWHACEATAPTVLSEPHSCQKVPTASLILWDLLLPNVSCQQYKDMWEIGKWNVTHSLRSKSHILTKKETLTSPYKTLRHYVEVTMITAFMTFMTFWEQKLLGQKHFQMTGQQTYFFAALPVSNSAFARKQIMLDRRHEIINEK